MYALEAGCSVLHPKDHRPQSSTHWLPGGTQESCVRPLASRCQKSKPKLSAVHNAALRLEFSELLVPTQNTYHQALQMGLASGAHGIKTFVKAKFPNALREFASLADAVKSSGHRPDQCVMLLDGNVMVNQVPNVVTDFDGYTRVFSGFVSQALVAADHVFVVWDEPKHVPKSKADEQRRRDRARAKTVIVVSSDLQEKLAPKDDDYGLEMLHRCNPHDLMANRKARPRFYDALCKRVMAELMSRRCNAGKSLTFDGIDERGGSRPPSQPREAGMFSSSDKIETIMARRECDAKIGEGDLKLTDLESDIQYNRNEGKLFLSIEIIFICTIDTDSIAIELMHQSSKNEASRASEEQGCITGKPIKSVLCFRETTGKRKDSDAPPQTLHACFDLDILHHELMNELFETSDEARRCEHLHRGAMALLSAGWCLCGCDFCQLKGMRSDATWAAIVQIARQETSVLVKMSPVWALTRKATDAEATEARIDLTAAIARLVQIAICKLSDTPRMARAVASAKLADQNDYGKAAWTILYWGGLERKDISNWGFVEE